MIAWINDDFLFGDFYPIKNETLKTHTCTCHAHRDETTAPAHAHKYECIFTVIARTKEN